jgi:3-methyladenine DNA glycosylase/8-oxoguanine DNA glycosylase
MSARAQETRTGLAWLHAADPVLAQVIDDRPDFDPDVWIRRLPAMDLFGALVFQIIGQQISVIAATAIFARLTEVKGIGAWTVQGALLIALQRPDIVRTDDLALRRSIQARYGLDHLPDPVEVADLARHWRPYRSLASSLLLAAARPI